jgi:hypothetical protein
MVSESRAKDADEAVALIREATKKVETLKRTPSEGVTTDGIAVVLDSAIERIEALRDDEGE